MQTVKIENVIRQLKHKKILVVGDLMIDHYIWGKVERISPEAPVPVVEVKKQEHRLGGAANVVNNLKSLGAEPFLIGVAGRDDNTSKLRNLIAQLGVSYDGIIETVSRPTTVKTRIIAHNQQVVRIDNEDSAQIDSVTENRIITKIETWLDTADAVIIEDYNKGMLTEKIIKYLVHESNKKGKIITVDPKFRNFFSYTDCTVFKPNLNELQKNLGIEITGDKDFEKASEKIMSLINPKYLVITMGDKGLAVFSQQNEFDGGKRYNIPTFAQEVYDVSGAGDTIISVLTLCLAAGLDIVNAAIVANHAAGAVCGKIGINPVNEEDIIRSYKILNNRN